MPIAKTQAYLADGTCVFIPEVEITPRPGLRTLELRGYAHVVAVFEGPECVGWTHASDEHVARTRANELEPVVRPLFGKEYTAEECWRRAAWERTQAVLVIGIGLGWEHMAEAHEITAKAYNELGMSKHLASKGTP